VGNKHRGHPVSHAVERHFAGKKGVPRAPGNKKTRGTKTVKDALRKVEKANGVQQLTPEVGPRDFPKRCKSEQKILSYTR